MKQDEKDLFLEHGELVRKKFNEGLSMEEQNKLDYIRRELDKKDPVDIKELTKEDQDGV